MIYYFKKDLNKNVEKYIRNEKPHLNYRTG